MKVVNQAAVAILGTTLLAGSAFARWDDSYFDYARVLSVNPVVTGENSEPVTQQECWSEPVEQFRPGTTTQRTLPPVVDESTGTVTTRTVSIREEGYYARDAKERCRTRTDYRQQPTITAWDVVYRYHGQDYHDRIGHDPGSRIRVHVDNGYVEVAE